LCARRGAHKPRQFNALQVKQMFCVLRNSEVWFRAIRGAKHQIAFVVLELSVLVGYVR